MEERISYIKVQKESLFKNLSQIPALSVFPSDTNFLIFRTTTESKTLLENLLAENVLVRDVSSYPMLSNMVRVNAGTESENKAFLSALKKYL
jgi:histidinol-phosphate aminotransferase